MIKVKDLGSGALMNIYERYEESYKRMLVNSKDDARKKRLIYMWKKIFGAHLERLNVENTSNLKQPSKYLQFDQRIDGNKIFSFK